MDYLRDVFDTKRVRLLITAGISLLVGFLFVFIGCKVSDSLDDQNFVERWGDDDYAQVTAFFSELAAVDDDGIRQIQFNIEKKLKEDSISKEDADSRLWISAYSANGEVNASSAKESVKVNAIGVGGDFFLFHPLKLVEGSYFSGDNIMKDLVVIDTDTAWKLFGSYNVIGQIVEIGSVRHVVVGVVEKETGKLNDLAGNGGPTLYLSYDSLKTNGTITYLNSFEALMPDPISDYAKDTLTKSIMADEARFEVIQNSGRYHWTKLLGNAKNFGTRGMTGKAIVFPYWENIARAHEDYLTPICLLGCVLFILPCGYLFYLLRRMWKKRTIHFADIKDFVERRIEELRERKKQKKGNGNEEVF